MSSEPIALRPYEASDAEWVWQAVHESLAELRPWMPWAHPNYAVEESRSWLEAQVLAREARRAFEFAITAADGSYLGGCGLNQIDVMNRRANIGYWVRSAAAGRGVATAAVRQLQQWANDNTDFVRLEILVAIGNLASQRVAEKVGARREGVLVNRLRLHDKAHDAVMFSLTR